MDSDTYCVNEPSVISEVVDGETIILNFESGHYYSFNATASGIWMRVRAGDPVTAVTEWVARRFGSTRRPSTTSEGFRPASRGRAADPARGSGHGPGTGGRRRAGRPGGGVLTAGLREFTDMEELLLLDPIHEVGSAGWPQKLESMAPARTGSVSVVLPCTAVPPMSARPSSVLSRPVPGRTDRHRRWLH